MKRPTHLIIPLFCSFLWSRGFNSYFTGSVFHLTISLLYFNTCRIEISLIMWTYLAWTSQHHVAWLLKAKKKWEEFELRTLYFTQRHDLNEKNIVLYDENLFHILVLRNMIDFSYKLKKQNTNYCLIFIQK